MAFLDFASGFGSQEEVSGPVGVKGAEDALFLDAIPKENHTLASVLFIHKAHFIDSVGGVV